MPVLSAAQDYGWVEEARTQHHGATPAPRRGQLLSIDEAEPRAAAETPQSARSVDRLGEVEAPTATSPDHSKQTELQSEAVSRAAAQTDFWQQLAAQNKDDLEGILAACEVHELHSLFLAVMALARPSSRLCHLVTAWCMVQGAHPSPSQAALALRKAARAAQRKSSPLRIMQA